MAGVNKSTRSGSEEDTDSDCALSTDNEETKLLREVEQVSGVCDAVLFSNDDRTSSTEDNNRIAHEDSDLPEMRHDNCGAQASPQITEAESSQLQKSDSSNRVSILGRDLFSTPIPSSGIMPKEVVAFLNEEWQAAGN